MVEEFLRATNAGWQFKVSAQVAELVGSPKFCSILNLGSGETQERAFATFAAPILAITFIHHAFCDRSACMTPSNLNSNLASLGQSDADKLI